jgi:hypothetical protein
VVGAGVPGGDAELCSHGGRLVGDGKIGDRVTSAVNLPRRAGDGRTKQGKRGVKWKLFCIIGDAEAAGGSIKAGTMDAQLQTAGETLEDLEATYPRRRKRRTLTASIFF